MALQMLAAYYSCGCDSGELFDGRRIAKERSFREHMNKYDVIFLNMQQFLIEAKNQKLTEYLDGDSACKKIRKPLCAEYVWRIFNDRPESIRRVYWIYRE